MDDRASPPIFVGREDIISNILQDVSLCRTNTSGSACFTRVIQGVPSAGKTSVLGEIKRRLSNAKHDGDDVTVVLMSGYSLSHEMNIVYEFLHALRGRRVDSDEKPKLEQQFRDTGSPWSVIARNLPIRQNPPVFLLLVDESQTIRGNHPSGGGELNNSVTDLHNGSVATQRLKITTVFAGLLDTAPSLYQAGIARLRANSTTQLGCLTPDETKGLVSSWMQHDEFGFEGVFSKSDIDRVSDLLTVACDCWPRHALSYLREFARSILDAGLSDDLAVDLNAVLERGHDSILNYYRRRSTGDLGCYAEALVDLAQQSSDGWLTKSDLFKHAHEKYQLSYTEIEKDHAKALHLGILEGVVEPWSNACRFPIPSQFTYMQLNGIGTKFKDAMRERMAAHIQERSKSEAVAHQISR